MGEQVPQCKDSGSALKRCLGGEQPPQCKDSGLALQRGVGWGNKFNSARTADQL